MSVNERIAALNARNSPSKQSSSYPSSLTPNLGGISVKDKAARFDGIGAAPVPKGSFGLGAPPGLKEKKSHELYGNRIPSVVKPAPTGTGNASRSSSTSRGSSPSGGAGLGAGRPLTEEAVEALGTAVPDLPAAVVDSHIHASHAFHSVPPSEVDDASSSVAADMDESEDTSVRGGGGMEEESGSRSPALSTGTNTNSTISDSAMREAPPVLSPASSTTNVAGMFSSVRPSMSNVATRASSSTVPRTSSALGVAFEATPPTSLSSEHSEDVVATMDDIPMIVEEPSVAPLRLSARLLESLDVSGVGGGPASESGLATPKSVMVETGSVAGGQIVDEDMKFEGSEDNVPRNDHEEAARPMTDSMDVDVTDLASDDGTGETGETRVQPELRISGPVLPLSQSHLKSLQSSGSFSGLSASPSMRSGMETPKSTYVEDGGSVDGREREELVDRAMENDVHEEYDDAAAAEATLPVEELYTPLISNLEIEDRQQGSGSPMPQSPAVLAYAQEITGESKAAGTKDVHLVVPPPGVDGTGTSEVRTPVAGAIQLPDATIAEKLTPDPMMTPTKIEDDKQRVSSGVPIPELTLDKDDHGAV
ncbi:hypothetical protein FRC02_009825 [Tulasnella sp. 418]|nr:hypothetical protein FRC02_009825 [Tulasnella sp. 418]